MATVSRSSGSLSSTLLLRLRDQDPAAWERLAQLFGPVVYQWCRRAGLRPADASDVTQDVFRSVAQGLPRFHRDRAGDTFRGWLAAIAHNRIRDFYRRQAGRPAGQGGTAFQQLLQNVPDAAIDGDSDAASATNVERRGVVRRSLELVRNEFEPVTWTAFWRTTVEDVAPADVAAELGISANAVYKAKSRILRRLRDELDGLVD